jgi:hypothetical protein
MWAVSPKRRQYSLYLHGTISQKHYAREISLVFTRIITAIPNIQNSGTVLPIIMEARYMVVVGLRFKWHTCNID